MTNFKRLEMARRTIKPIRRFTRHPMRAILKGMSAASSSWSPDVFLRVVIGMRRARRPLSRSTLRGKTFQQAVGCIRIDSLRAEEVGLVVLQRNYLEVYPYDKWASTAVPDFSQGEQFLPSVCELKEGQTSRPSLLTEADLVGLMDKNGIGQLPGNRENRWLNSRRDGRHNCRAHRQDHRA